MIDFVQNTVDGIMFGSSYALLAIGFTIVFGVMRRLNLAFGATIMLGAYAGTWLHVHYEVNVLVVALTTLACTVLAGIYVERLCFRAVRRDAALASMVSSFVIWMQLEEVAIHLLPERTYPFPSLFVAGSFELGPFLFRAEQATMLVLAAVMVGALHLLLHRTRYGLALRAMSESPRAADYMGIDTGWVMLCAFALVSLVGGVAGYAILATDEQITPFFGLWATFKGLIALSAYLLLITGEISFGQQAYFGLSAYAAGAATAMFGLPIWAGILIGACAAGFTAMAVGALTLRLSGLYFSISTLAFAEMVRLILLIVEVQVEVDGEMVGPDGANGFHDIRWMFERDISLTEFMLMIYGLLALVLVALLLVERSRLGSVFRMLGSDDLLAEMQGLNTVRYRILAAGMAGAIAGIGGALYAHFTTYVEPQFFNVMLGVHALAYGLIGGFGTAFGPLIGVAIGIGFLEAVRFIQGYRMIVFGGLVAVLLIFMPRGILDEERVHRLKVLLSRRSHAGAPGH